MDARDRDEQTKHHGELEQQLSSAGLIGSEMFGRFVEAHICGTATPMQWLEGHLRVLRRRLERGEAVTLHEPAVDEVRPCASVAELAAWVGAHLPGAAIHERS